MKQAADISEQATLWLGLAGFDASARAALAALLPKPRAQQPHWKIGDFHGADGWWLNSANVSVSPDGVVTVPGDKGASQMQLKVNETDRPVAFTTPLGSHLGKDFEPFCTVDPTSAAGVADVLQLFEDWLSPVLAQFALGAHIHRRNTQLTNAVYHLNRQAALVAVIDLRSWRVGIQPGARAEDFEQASWDKRPPSASDIPRDFDAMSLTQVMWNYAQRTSADVLPPRYREGLIFFRRSPRVPSRVLQDSQLLLLRELAAGPVSFRSLSTQFGLPEDQVARDLASLYFAGSITSSRSEADTAPGDLPRGSATGFGASPLGEDSALSGRRDSDPPFDGTAPAPLRYD